MSKSDSILLQKPGTWTRYDGNAPANFAVHSTTPSYVMSQSNDTNAYQHGGWTQDAEDLLLGANDYVNDSARLYTPFDDTTASLDNPPLYKSLSGRLLTQSVARGVTGAAFFAIGNYMLSAYNKNPDASFNDQPLIAKPIKAVEGIFDHLLERPARAIVEKTHSLTHDAAQSEAFTNELFRFNKYVPKQGVLDTLESGETLTNAKAYGVTWAQEIVQRTWSFASGSIGAALGRNAVSILDPNHKTSWLDDDGSIDVKDLVQSSAKSLMQIMTYNQMEDWFAAPFYTVQLRAQRGLYDNGLFNREASTDAGIVETQLLGNSGSRHIRSDMVDNQLQGTIGESYTGLDMADYHGRFGLYNTYTLIFRDAYNHMFKNRVDETCTPENEAGHGQDSGLLHKASEGAKYLVKSLIKSQIYMQPSILLFAPERIGGAKAKHGFIDDATGMPLTTSAVYEFNALDPNQTVHQAENNIQPFNKNVLAKPADMNAHLQSPDTHKLYVGSTPIYIKHDRDGFDAYTDSHGIIDKSLNASGKITDIVSNVVNVAVQPLGAGYAKLHNMVQQDTDKHIDAKAFKKDVRDMAHDHAAAAVSYLPYMASKYEFANLWDTPVMDAAAYRFTDGLFALKPKEMLAGLKDIGSAVAFQPVSEETQQNINKHRGLVNSRFEGKCRTDAAQVKIKHDHEVARLEKIFNDDATQYPYNAAPDTHISQAQYIEQQRDTSTHTKPSTQKSSAVWADYTSQRAQDTQQEEISTHAR